MQLKRIAQLRAKLQAEQKRLDTEEQNALKDFRRRDRSAKEAAAKEAEAKTTKEAENKKYKEAQAKEAHKKLLSHLTLPDSKEKYYEEEAKRSESIDLLPSTMQQYVKAALEMEYEMIVKARNRQLVGITPEDREKLLAVWLKVYCIGWKEYQVLAKKAKQAKLSDAEEEEQKSVDGIGGFAKRKIDALIREKGKYLLKAKSREDALNKVWNELGLPEGDFRERYQVIGINNPTQKTKEEEKSQAPDQK